MCVRCIDVDTFIVCNFLLILCICCIFADELHSFTTNCNSKSVKSCHLVVDIISVVVFVSTITCKNERASEWTKIECFKWGLDACLQGFSWKKMCTHCISRCKCKKSSMSTNRQRQNLNKLFKKEIDKERTTNVYG